MVTITDFLEMPKKLTKKQKAALANKNNTQRTLRNNVKENNDLQDVLDEQPQEKGEKEDMGQLKNSSDGGVNQNNLSANSVRQTSAVKAEAQGRSRDRRVSGDTIERQGRSRDRRTAGDRPHREGRSRDTRTSGDWPERQDSRYYSPDRSRDRHTSKDRGGYMDCRDGRCSSSAWKERQNHDDRDHHHHYDGRYTAENRGRYGHDDRYRSRNYHGSYEDRRPNYGYRYRNSFSRNFYGNQQNRQPMNKHINESGPKVEENNKDLERKVGQVEKTVYSVYQMLKYGVHAAAPAAIPSAPMPTSTYTSPTSTYYHQPHLPQPRPYSVDYFPPPQFPYPAPQAPVPPPYPNALLNPQDAAVFNSLRFY